ncbi:hypothetical protein [Caldisalinibacter kiritimatiensis]|uniref:Membrane spanning protein n=1 Tax=Caldisalinibacter kiritimatiensis TaxID=1304284 RepID=R1CYR4_9FIRM|nr:hypothetical protein [Caldisalinibacter kiritimatiensis]EOD01724.1 Membrane spanning protein [Caldisalinibacter kiritimatiensis]
MGNNKKKDSKKTKKRKKYNIKWVLLITFWTFVLAVSVSMISESIMRNFDIIMAFITLILIIFLGVVFDLIGISVAIANEAPFHSMAANKVQVARYAVRLIRNAGPVSNFCSDVIGDIAGIISGAAGTIIVIKLLNIYGIKEGAFVSIVMSGIIAALTVGGKAYGKEIAINNANKIVLYTANFFMILHKKFGIDLLPRLKKKKKIKKER